MFKKGEYIVYKRDLCQIKEVEEKYYKLSPVMDKTLSIKVLIDNNQNYLRTLITKEEALKFIQKIPEIEPLNTNEKLLENEYKNLLRTNLHEDLIKIIKTTYLRNECRKNSGKKMSDKDLIYFNMAEKFLYTELSYVLNQTIEECKEYIIKNIEKTHDHKGVSNPNEQ